MPVYGVLRSQYPAACSRGCAHRSAAVLDAHAGDGDVGDGIGTAFGPVVRGTRHGHVGGYGLGTCHGRAGVAAGHCQQSIEQQAAGSVPVTAIVKDTSPLSGYRWTTRDAS